MSDSRFARLKSDPRFRRPRQKESKVVVDERFTGVFSQGKKKGHDGRVDKYGRSISDTHEQDNLRRFYRLGTEEGAGLKAPLDYARGEVLLESSDEDSESDIAELVTIGQDHSHPISVSEDEQLEVDLEENNFADLDAQAVAYLDAHPVTVPEEGSQTSRLAVVNLDWDHVRASHLYKICASLVSPTAPAVFNSSDVPAAMKERRSKSIPSSTVVRGRILSVRVYPSNFGKERMALEEKEGPPSEIFKRRTDVDKEVTAQNIYDVGGEDDYDEDALRKYQLERLRYFYAIINCDTVDAASHIYRELDGTELERSANVFDLSFVPEDMTFDDVCRDEATSEPASSFRNVDFVTDALRHSKVKLTWDEDDPERNQVTRRKLSKKEIEDADFKAYLASSSESETDQQSTIDSRSKVEDKKKSVDKIRALLLAGGDDDLPEGWGHDDNDTGDLDMEVTFTPGLSERHEDETTLQKYQRKMRDKRKKRKGEAREKTDGNVGDEFLENGGVPGREPVDPTTRATVQNIDKKDQKEKPELIMRPLSTREELELLVTADNPDEGPKHFNLTSVLKAEKKSKRKSKKGKKHDDEREDDLQEDFTINVKDDRFKVLHEDHQYAIDPTNPQFKHTKAMTALLAERVKRQKSSSGQEFRSMSENSTSGTKTLTSLVENVKRKSVNIDVSNAGKRRKL